MKLAEALVIRKDLATRCEQLEGRINNNVQVQEGEEPLEDPVELMKELEACFAQQEKLIWRINATNMQVKDSQGVCLTERLAERDVLFHKIKRFQSIFDAATEGQNRYSRTEIKQVTVIDVKALSKKLDALHERLRKLDVEIQSCNFTAELAEI